MKFDRIEIDAFGALRGTRIERLGERLNLVYGVNGAGKTTLLHFLRGLFCGYDGARRLGLLSGSGEAPGGGVVTGVRQGAIWTFQRSAGEPPDQPLQIRRSGSSPPTTQLDVDSRGLPTRQIPLLFMVGAAEALAVDRLVQMAIDDGVELITPGRNPAQDREAARRRNEFDGLLRDLQSRMADLSRQRTRLLAAWEQLKLQHDERLQSLRDELRERQARESRHWRQRVDWLDAELQAAECDLREADEQTWRPADRWRPVILRQPVRLRRPPATDHLQAASLEKLKAIDRRVIEARRQLEAIARDRQEINLRAARIAGCEELPTAEFLSALRQSLGAVEDELLDLRDDAARLAAARRRGACGCESWSAAAASVVQDVCRRLYRACETISTFELHHLQVELRNEAARLDREEQTLRAALESYKLERRRLIAQTGHLTVWTGEAQQAASRAMCRCTEHEPCEAGRTTGASPAGRTDEPSSSSVVDDLPPVEDLARLRQRRDQLRHDLDAARDQWRAIRRNAQLVDLPEDVVALERAAAETHIELENVEQELSGLQHQERRLTRDAEHDAAHSTLPNEDPLCLQRAASFLSQLTGGRYTGLRLEAAGRSIQIVDAHGSELSWRAVSRGLLGQVALSLRLALVEAYAARGVRFPLVFDDVLVDCDTDRLQAAVELLREFSEQHDQQIVYLTCGSHVLRLFESAGATVRTLAAPPVGRSEEPGGWSVRGWVNRRRPAAREPFRTTDGGRLSESRPDLATGSVLAGAAETDPLTVDDHEAVPRVRRQPGSVYWLSADSAVLSVPSIGEQMGRRLCALGIRTVADLIELTADESSIPLRSLQVDVGRLREWQAEALLLTCVPDLTAPDAQLLVAGGIVDPHQLAESDVAQLVHRLDRLSRRNRDLHLHAAVPSREDLQRWIHSARRSRSVEEALDQGRRRSLDLADDEPTAATGPVLQRGTELASIEHGADGENPAVVGRVVPADYGNRRNVTDVKFYLGPDSPIVEAPSIGPKMAARLERLGIRTVADLLARQPDVLAEKLGNRRISTATVTQWQQQARLMCRIPQLRGHDAQVLVACHITEPEQVARMDARTLLGIVEPFVESTEGRRLLRSNKSPDLEEIAQWISRASQARPLRAA